MNDMSMVKTDNDWSFPVNTFDLNAVSEELDTVVSVPRNIARAIVRTDNNKIMGVHGDRYKAILHDDVVNGVHDALKQANISNDYNEKIEVLDEGRKLRGTINFPDLVIEPSVGDYINFQIVFYNSYDGSWSFGHSARGLRLWCDNGCTTPDTVAKTVSKHTTNVNVEGSAAKIQVGLDAFFKSRDVYKTWIGETVEDIDAEEFLKKNLCGHYTRTTEKRHNKKQLEVLMTEWFNNVKHLGRNKWSLYNTMTAWATHTGHLTNPAVTSRSREVLVSKAYGRLLAA